MQLFYNPEHCTLCPRGCGAVRGNTIGKGFCQMPDQPMVARAALHQWEEPPISGTKGAGTVFFSGCALRCVYCQNDRISQQNFGKVISKSHLREIFNKLIQAGAHNIDLVNPSHFSHVIGEVLEAPLSVPVIWNSSGYDRVSTLQALAGKIQIYLPDFKYPDSHAALRFSEAEDYPSVAKNALIEMVRQTGPYVLDENGLLKRGVMIRHLLLPGRLQQAKEVMDWIAQTFEPKSVLFSLMGQYVPCGRAEALPALNRVLRKSELKAAIQYMSALGLEGYIQEDTSAVKEYVPAFDLTGVKEETVQREKII